MKEVYNLVEKFKEFQENYKEFRRVAGLTRKIDNVHEILTGMTDKHGRICRYIKHQERKDPKSDWPNGMTSAMTGYIVYMLMLIDHYNVDIGNGMMNELNEAIKQYKK